jgi:beta-aspartyl-peptidase (threonine type)
MIAIHAGAAAGTSIVVEAEERCREALLEALEDARAVLENGGDAVSAVQAAVMVMEDFELFNAGRGAVLCADGSVELSASLMRGSDRAAGAVAAVKRTKNPIAGALAVLRSDQVLMVGEAADRRAAAAGAEQVDPSHFVTERQRERLARLDGAGDHATVGAVCVDARGQLAAATSTGGIRAQPPGRVGDSPLIGAGTWADAGVAVSCTGDGEVFVRVGVARYIGALVEQGMAVEQACERALAQVRELGGVGGLVAVGARGEAALPFLTAVMPRGIWRAGEEPLAWVGESSAASLAR